MVYLSSEVVVCKYSFQSQQSYLEVMLNDQWWISTTLFFFLITMAMPYGFGYVISEAHCVYLRVGKCNTLISVWQK